MCSFCTQSVSCVALGAVNVLMVILLELHFFQVENTIHGIGNTCSLVLKDGLGDFCSEDQHA